MGNIVAISKYILNLKLFKKICQNLYSTIQFLKNPVKKLRKVSNNSKKVQRFYVFISLVAFICRALLKHS